MFTLTFEFPPGMPFLSSNTLSSLFSILKSSKEYPASPTLYIYPSYALEIFNIG